MPPFEAETLLPGYGGRVVGRCPSFNIQFGLPKDDVQLSGLYDDAWVSLFGENPDEYGKRVFCGDCNVAYDRDAFRVIQPTRPSLQKALYSLLEHEPMKIHPDIWELICKQYPLMRSTTSIVEVSSDDFTPLDPELFEHALNIYADGMRKFYGPQLFLWNSRQNLSTSPGPDAKSVGCLSKEEYLFSHVEHAMSWSDREEPVVFSVAGKTEPIKRSKWETGTIRPFNVQHAASHFETANQFCAANKKMAEEGESLRSPVAVGWAQQNGKFIHMMKSLDLPPLGQSYKTFSGDAKGWDKFFEKLFWQLEFAWRL